MSRLPGVNLKKSYSTFSSYCPLQIWALKTCNQGILKIIIAYNFNLGHMIEDDDLVKIKKKSCKILFELLPFANLALKT